MVLHHIGKLVSLISGGDDSSSSPLDPEKHDAADASEEASAKLLPPPELLQPFGENLWFADGPDVNFLGFAYSTRMVVIRLSAGGSWIWSPIALNDKLIDEVISHAGPVQYIVSPNKLHWLYLKEWQDRFPSAKIYAPPGLAHRDVVNDIRFHSDPTGIAVPEYVNDIDQVVFSTQGIFDEVAYFHKLSRTVIFGDLIQRFPDDHFVGWKKWIMNHGELIGSNGTAPPDVRHAYALFGHLPGARRALNVVLYQWQPQQLIVAHGLNEPRGDNISHVVSVIDQAFRWVPEQPRECVCGCIPHRHSRDTPDVHLPGSTKDVV